MITKHLNKAITMIVESHYSNNRNNSYEYSSGEE